MVQWSKKAKCTMTFDHDCRVNLQRLIMQRQIFQQSPNPGFPSSFFFQF